MASSLSEAIAVWPMLRSVILASSFVQDLEAAQQHLEAVVRTGAELKAGQPFEIVLQVFSCSDESLIDMLVAAIRSAGGGKVAVRWESTIDQGAVDCTHYTKFAGCLRRAWLAMSCIVACRPSSCHP